MNCLLQDELNCGCLFEVLTRYLNYQGDEHIYALASEVTKQPKGTSCLLFTLPFTYQNSNINYHSYILIFIYVLKHLNVLSC